MTVGGFARSWRCWGALRWSSCEIRVAWHDLGVLLFVVGCGGRGVSCFGLGLVVVVWGWGIGIVTAPVGVRL